MGFRKFEKKGQILMIKKYVRLWILDEPKNLPFNSKLKISYNQNYGMDKKTFEFGSDPFYISYFEYKTGKLKDGTRIETNGKIDCKVFNSLNEAKVENVQIVKDWGKKELKKVFLVEVFMPNNRLAVEIAVRHYLVEIKRLPNFYGGYPLAQIRYIIYDGKRVN